MSRGAQWHLAAAAVLVGSACAPPAGAQDVDEARQALATGRYQEAIRAFRALAGGGDVAAVIGLLEALCETGAYDEAERVATAAARDQPNGRLSNALGEIRLLRGDLGGAEQAFEAAVAAPSPDSLMAKLNLAALYHERGARDRAYREFGAFIDLYNRGAGLGSRELLAVATAVRYLGARDPQLFKDALRAYDEAAAAAGGNVDARLAAGELLLEKYNGTDAHATFEGVLAVNPRHPRALLGLARTKHFDGSDEALELVQQALEVNPNLVPARAFLAQLYLEMEDYGAAIREAERALAVNPSSLEALSLLAATRFLLGERDAFEELRRRILALNARYADLYATLALVHERNRRYHEAVEFARDAVTIDSTSWRGFALLGRNLLRVGRIAEGRTALESAFAGDPYDVWTKNTLDLLDAMRGYAETGSRRFRFAIDADEADVLTIYFGALAEEAYDSLTARYGYRAETPVRVEVFPSHADFSVRTVGLVGLGALGVSFGPVVAMDSPSARDAGHFNWGATLWHELAHTFHLGMSRHRVPRWFAEGLAVFEERHARPAWGSDVTPGFLAALLQDSLLPVSRLNRGFARPSYPEQLQHSYYQASLVCELIERDHGLGALRRMLTAYGEGRSTREIVRAVLETDLDAFDRRFDAYLRERFAGPLAAMAKSLEGRGGGARRSGQDVMARARSEPGDYLAQLAAGRLLAERGDLEGAVPFLERAKTLFPEYAGDDSPYWYLARIHRERGNARGAAAELAALSAINERHLAAHRLLAELRMELGDTAGAAESLERALYVDPLDTELHARLAHLYGRVGRWDRAVRERRALLALHPVDRAEAAYQLARAYFRAGDLHAARGAVLDALERAPAFEAAQELLLEIHAADREGSRP